MKYELKDYLVSELAKFYGVSGDTIRHYDRKGILESHKSEENNYRMYSRDDFMLMDYIIRLRKMETPLEEIHKIVNIYSEEETREFFIRREQEVADKIRQLQQEQSMISDHLKTLENFRGPDGEIQIGMGPAIIAKAITTSAYATMEYFERATIGTLPILTIAMPEEDFLAEGFVEQIRSTETRPEVSEIILTALDRNKAHQRTDFPRKDFEIIPAGRYVYFAEKLVVHSDYSTIGRIADFVKEKKLKLRHGPFIRMVAIEDNHSVDYNEYWIPIE